MQRNIQLQAMVVPGDLNCEADAISRISILVSPSSVLDQREWVLNQQVANQLFHRLGFPVLDLFASRNNFKLPRWFSWDRDNNAEAWNAFSQSWDVFAYAFPPHAILRRVIQKIKADKPLVILIAPYWPQSPWLSDLLEMLVDLPVVLPSRHDLLHQQGLFHDNPSFWKLVAWKVSGNPIGPRVFRTRLLTLSRPLEGRVPRERIMPSGLSLNAGVVQGVSIPFTLL